MATRCFTPVFGKRLRLTVLDECGNPPAAETENSVASTDGFISVSMTAEVEDGTEIVQKKANGDLCVNERQSNSFKRFNIEIAFCGVDPGILSAGTNAEIYEGFSTDPIGIVIPEGAINKKFALELWTGLSGQACEPGVEEASGYMLLPFVNAGTLGDLTIDGENAVSFTMSGAYTRGGNGWGVGPYEVVAGADDAPSVLPTPLDPLDHLLLVETGIAPPPSQCGLQAMPAAPTP